MKRLLALALALGCAPVEPAQAPAPATDSDAPPVVEVAAPPAEPLVTEAPVPTASSDAPVTVRDDGLEWVDLARGGGAPAEKGRVVVVHYDGRLEDGTTFDSSRKRGRPFEIALGEGRLIRGFEEGVLGMREGGLRRITIPPKLGYGDRGVGGKIPPGSVLIFEVELLEVKDQPR